MSHELVQSIKPNKERMLKMANIGYTTSADFADYLVKEKKITFIEAYNISSKVVIFDEK